LREFWERDGRGDAMQPLVAWFREAEVAEWRSPADIKRHYATASFVGDDRVVFNIGGNKYRLVVAVRYELGIVFIRFVGTHAQYDRIDARKV
jgi:mRNA interferase HigB